MSCGHVIIPGSLEKQAHTKTITCTFVDISINVLLLVIFLNNKQIIFEKTVILPDSTVIQLS
jgi:hypothetical protein